MIPPVAYRMIFSGRDSTPDHINLRGTFFRFFGVFRTGTERDAYASRSLFPIVSL